MTCCATLSGRSVSVHKLSVSIGAMTPDNFGRNGSTSYMVVSKILTGISYQRIAGTAQARGSAP